MEINGKKMLWFKMWLNAPWCKLPEFSEFENEDEAKEERGRTAFEVGAALINAIAKANGEPLPFKMNRSTRLVYNNIMADIEKSNQNRIKQAENGKQGGAPEGNRNAAKVLDISERIREG